VTDQELIQGSDEWRLSRCGSLGASQVSLALAKTKSGWSASRYNIQADLIAERLTGKPTENFTNAAMQRGTEKEPEARKAYELAKEVWVSEVGIVRHPKIEGTHASPDGLIGEDGLVEIKCPNTATHLEFLQFGTIDGKYITQMQWQMACTGRKWCDFVSYDDRLPERMHLFIKRVTRDANMIAELETHVSCFVQELQTKLDALTKAYG
jgi:putative phage-type endonuclease